MGRSHQAVEKMHGHINLARDMKLSFAFSELLTSFLDMQVASGWEGTFGIESNLNRLFRL